MGDPIYALVAQDIKDRAELGRVRYGDYLMASTEVDHLQYAYEEALDLCMYLRAEIERRQNASKT